MQGREQKGEIQTELLRQELFVSRVVEKKKIERKRDVKIDRRKNEGE